MKSLSLPVPHIIAMVGIPGSGKSHFAQKFAETFSTPFLCYHYLQHLSEDDDEVHSTTLELLREFTKTQQTIVYEGDTDQKKKRDELVKFARQLGYKVVFVWVQTDLNTARKRVEKIMLDSAYDTKLGSFDAPHEKEKYVVISGRHTYATQARTLLKRLTEQSRPAAEIERPRASSPIIPPRSSTNRSRS